MASDDFGQNVLHFPSATLLLGMLIYDLYYVTMGILAEIDLNKCCYCYLDDRDSNQGYQGLETFTQTNEPQSPEQLFIGLKGLSAYKWKYFAY